MIKYVLLSVHPDTSFDEVMRIYERNGLGCVQKLVGLDNDEMDCLEDSFDFIVLVTSSGTTIASSVYVDFWTKKEN